MGNIFISRHALVEPGCVIGDNSSVWHFSHIQEGARIGKNCMIGSYCQVATGAIIGNNVRIQNGVYVYSGVIIEDDVFIAPHATFTNVKRPRTYRRGRFEQTLIRRGAAIGANATIICGVTIGENAFVGAGSVVTRDVPDNMTAWGVPARIVSYQWIKRDLSNMGNQDG